jgi:pimeloyl-ACP methyl ester carboxylesterase
MQSWLPRGTTSTIGSPPGLERQWFTTLVAETGRGATRMSLAAERTLLPRLTTTVNRPCRSRRRPGTLSHRPYAVRGPSAIHRWRLAAGVRLEAGKWRARRDRRPDVLPLIDLRLATASGPNDDDQRWGSLGETREKGDTRTAEPQFHALDEVVLHGHRVFYRSAGSGPVVVLVHGITSTSATWAGLIPYLGERFTVIAPDLLGHGESAKPRGDYSLGAYASGIRDLLIALGHERATFVGHSLGGGVAMQLAYQFPEHCERLALVSSGGLGREINPLLRAASVPGSELLLPLLVNERILETGRVLARLLGRVGLRVHTDLEEVLRGHASLADGEARSAFLHTLRTIVDPRGQRVDASDRLYLAEALPFVIVWGERDPIVPVEHALAAHRLVPSSRLEVFPDAGHFPHLDDPLRFVRLLIDFMETTAPARVDARRWGELLRGGAKAAGAAPQPSEEIRSAGHRLSRGRSAIEPRSTG